MHFIELSMSISFNCNKKKKEKTNKWIVRVKRSNPNPTRFRTLDPQPTRILCGSGCACHMRVGLGWIGGSVGFCQVYKKLHKIDFH